MTARGGTTFRGYESRVIKTADIKAGDLIYVLGAGMLCQIQAVRHGNSGATELVVQYTVHGRGRRGTITRRTDGKSTIHIREEQRPGESS
jgi:hypothetical protein